MSELWGAVLQQPLGFSLPSMIVAAPRDKNNGRHRSGMVELVEIVCSIATSVNPTPKIRVMLHHQPEGKPNLIEMQPTFSSFSTDARDGHSSAKVGVRPRSSSMQIFLPITKELLPPLKISLGGFCLAERNVFNR